MNFLPRFRCLSLLQQNLKSINQQKQIHAQLITNNTFNSILIAAKLIQLTSSQAPNYAYLIFSHFTHPNTYLFNVLIKSLPPINSIQVFAKWVSKNYLVFDDFTYIFVLGACARSDTVLGLHVGKQIHAQIVKSGFGYNILVQTTCIHFYASNRDIVSAERVFDEMPVRSSATWNAMMTGYCSQRDAPYKYARKAIMLFKGMLLLVDDRGVRPTDTTLVCVLSAASQLGVVETGASVHGFIEKTIHRPENDVFIGTALVDMYSKCGSLDSAVAIFDRMRETNVWTWTAIITGLAFHGKGSEALQLLHTMESYGVKPNEVTFTSLLSACCHGGLVKEGLHLFHEMESRFGVTPRIQHYGCIVDLLGRAGQLKEAYEFIMSMPVDPDAVLWRSLLGSCKIHGDVLMGEKVGKHLLQLQTGRSNVQSDDSGEDYVALSNIYASADRWQEVEMIRDVIKVEGKENKPGFSIIQTVRSHDLDGIWDCVALGAGDRDQDS